jgi:hypothetical protein
MKLLIASIAGTLIIAAFWMLQGPVSGADDQTKPAEKAAAKDKPGVKKRLLRVFMRKKLAASQSVLEGLVVEDFEMIADGANQLNVTATAGEFMSSNDETYVEHADDFRRIVNKLTVAAKEKRLDGATLAYMDMTMKCVDCHKHVRTAPIVEPAN